MANKNEEVEKIAQEEIYPERYFGRSFPGEWPSDRHHAICLSIAENRYDVRKSQEKEEKSGLDKRKRTSSGGSEPETD